MTNAVALVLRVQAGDQDAEARLIREHSALACKLALRYRRAVADDKDWRQLCSVALLTAARRWRPGRAAFSTYVALVVKFTFSQHLRVARWFGGPQCDPATKRYPAVSLDEPIFADDPDAGTLADAIPADARTDPHALAEAAEARRGVALALQRLTPLERRVLLARCGYGNDGEPVKLTAIAAHAGTSRDSARRIEQRALGKVRKAARGGRP